MVSPHAARDDRPHRSLVWHVFVDALVGLLARRNLRSDRFGTVAAMLGVALGTATVNLVLVLDANTVRLEAGRWATDPGVEAVPSTVALRNLRQLDPREAGAQAKEDTHEDYEVMRSAIRLGSLSAFLVGALIVFFTFAVALERRRREIALLRSLGALPRQVAAVLVREALIIGLTGAALGFLATVPLSYAAALAGITTTGRSHINVRTLVFPWDRMLLVSLLGAAVALLGVLRPARDVLRLDVSKTLRPRFLDREGPLFVARTSRGITLITLPFAALLYLLMRPFFQRALPSLTFFVIEATCVCAAFLATLMLVPELVRHLGALLMRLLPGSSHAAGLLVRRRVQYLGHELGWSVSGMMLVFALLLALHIATFALKREVLSWSRGALRDDLFLLPLDNGARADQATAHLPPGTTAVHFSTKTPWPTPISSAHARELQSFARATGDPSLRAIAERFGPGTIILSTLMARRHQAREGDMFLLSRRGRSRRLRVVGITDAIGFMPLSGAYRNAKTYGLIDAADHALIAPFVASIGTVAVVTRDPGVDLQSWMAPHMRLGNGPRLRFISAAWFARARVQENDRDFLIFDVILVLTSILAAVGIANQLVLSVHARRREIGLYRVLGMTTAQVRGLILSEGLLVGVLGGILAALLGAPLGYAAIGALRAVSAFIVDFQLPVSYLLITVVCAIFVSLGAALYPAARAARLDSAESVHYE